MNNLRDCYVLEKRKFNAKYQEEEWLGNRKIIPEYIENQLEIRKEQKERMQKFGTTQQISQDQTQPISEVKQEVKKIDQGYF